MNTKIITQEFFKDAAGKVWCVDIMLMNKDSWQSEIQKGWAPISKKEADRITNPPLTEEQLFERPKHKSSI
ncbi:hypothetical protein ACISK3_02900 [Morganella morganii]